MDKLNLPVHLKPYVGQITSLLAPLITEQRLEKMQKISAQRSRQVCVVFENTHHAHNISAVLRTMDAIGFLDVFFLYHNPHIRFRANDTIDRSASKWLLINSFSSIQETAEKLKQDGYKIALVSRPDFSRTANHYCQTLQTFSTEQFEDAAFCDIIKDHKIALVFGTELFGLSEAWNQYADFYVFIEMYGFSESFNISVCAAILLNRLRETLKKKNTLKTLSQYDQQLLTEYWIVKSTPHAKEYIQKYQPNLIELYMTLLNNNANKA